MLPPHLDSRPSAAQRTDKVGSRVQEWGKFTTKSHLRDKGRCSWQGDCVCIGGNFQGLAADVRSINLRRDFAVVVNDSSGTKCVLLLMGARRGTAFAGEILGRSLCLCGRCIIR